MLKVAKRGRSFVVTGTIMGQRVRRSVQAHSMEDAQRMRIEMERTLMATPQAGVTFKQVADSYVEWRRPHESTVAAASRLADRWGHLDVTAVRLEDVRDWCEERGHSDGTLRKMVKLTRTLLYHGENAGLYALPRRLRVALPGEPDPRDRFLETAEEVEALIECADEWFKPLVTFLFHTGARIGAACNLDWSHVVGQTVVLTTRKGAGKLKRYHVPLNSKARWAIERQRAVARTGHVFRSASGGVLWTQKVYEPWSQMCERAGVDDFTPHDARRTFATLLIRKGVAPETIAKLMGHEGTAMLKRYAYLAPSQLASAVEVL